MEPSVLSRSRMTGKKTVNSRRIMAAVMVIVMLAALTGCVGKEDTQTRKKNKVVEIPMILTVDSSTGNKNEEEVVELFEQAGISRFPETWEEFWKCCEKLKAAGITPLALHTEGTAWAAMLLATAEVAGSEEGAAFMKQLYPDTYQNEPGLEIAGTLKKLFQYTTQDALHNDFDVAYDNFVAGNAAMIPNGYWMIDQIPEEMQKKVCFSTFPENKLIGSPETFGWAVVSTYSEKVKKGAVEFLKFRTKLNKEQKEELLNSRTRQEGTLLDDYLKAYTGNPQIVPNYQVKWNSLLQEDVLGECLAELVQGKITEQEFTQAEDESIRQFEEEQ